jgi:hypothetical protein
MWRGLLLIAAQIRESIRQCTFFGKDTQEAMCVPAGLKATFLTELSQTSCPLSGALLFFPLGEHFKPGAGR